MKILRNLNATKRRNLYIGIAAGAFLLAAFALSRPGVLKNTAPPVKADNLLGTADSHAIGIASINQEVDKTQNTVGELSKHVKELELQNQELRNNQSNSSGIPAQTPGQVAGQPATAPNYAALPPPPVPTVGPGGAIGTPYYGGSPGGLSGQNQVQGQSDAPPEIITVGGSTPAPRQGAAAPGQAYPPPANTGAPDASAQAYNPPPAPAQGDEAASESAAPAKPSTPKIFIPAGTMLTGVLITGLDAPTGREAASKPIPMLVRIKEDAVLPNQYTADYKECFIVASGTGDLSSERAYIRGETLSCVATSGGVIQAHLEMWGTGEDGKAGMRGTLVSKQGSAMAKAILAGFAGGIGQAFTPQQQSVITTGGSGFTTVPLGTAGRMAVGGGVSSAAQEIAQFYVKMADSEFPVIEVSAGRPVTFIVEKGAELSQLEGTKG